MVASSNKVLPFSLDTESKLNLFKTLKMSFEPLKYVQSRHAPRKCIDLLKNFQLLTL